MAGRAGRRGKDTEGHVYLLLRDVPAVNVVMRVIKPSTDIIQSQFRIDYPMILNILRVEDLSLESVLSHSFAEAVRMRELDQNDYKQKLRDIDGLLVHLKELARCPQLADVDTILDIARTRRLVRQQELADALAQYQQNQKNKTEVFCRGRFVVAAVQFVRFEEVALFAIAYADRPPCTHRRRRRQLRARLPVTAGARLRSSRGIAGDSSLDRRRLQGARRPADA